MENTRTPTRRFALLATVVVALGSLVACSSGPVGRSVAATVEGREISVDQVTDLIEAQQRYLESQVDQPGTDPQALAAALAGITGAGTDTYNMAEASAALESWITYTILIADIEANGGEVTDADRDAARADLVTRLGSEEALAAVDQVLLDFSIDSIAADTVARRLAAEQSTADPEQRIQELFEEIGPTRPLCLNLIVSETEADSQAALARIDAGEEFGAVAAEVSADPATAAANGFAGCASVEQAAEYFGGDYSTAAEGEVIGPVPLNELFVLVEVDSTTGPTLEQMRPELEEQVAAEETNVTGEYVLGLALAADVTVDPRFGTWDAETGTLTPPVA